MKVWQRQRKHRAILLASRAHSDKALLLTAVCSCSQSLIEAHCSEHNNITRCWHLQFMHISSIMQLLWSNYGLSEQHEIRSISQLCLHPVSCLKELFVFSEMSLMSLLCMYQNEDSNARTKISKTVFINALSNICISSLPNVDLCVLDK